MSLWYCRLARARPMAEGRPFAHRAYCIVGGRKSRAGCVGQSGKWESVASDGMYCCTYCAGLGGKAAPGGSVEGCGADWTSGIMHATAVRRCASRDDGMGMAAGKKDKLSDALGSIWWSSSSAGLGISPAAISRSADKSVSTFYTHLCIIPPCPKND